MHLLPVGDQYSSHLSGKLGSEIGYAGGRAPSPLVQPGLAQPERLPDLVLGLFILAGGATGWDVLRGAGLTDAATAPLPKWSAPIVLLMVWGVGLFVFALYYSIASAVELLAEIRENTRRA